MKLRNICKSNPKIKSDRHTRSTGAGANLNTLEELTEFIRFGSIQGDGTDPWDDPDWGTLCHVLDPDNEHGLADMGNP